MTLRYLSVLFICGYLSLMLIHASDVPWQRLGLGLYAAAGAGIIFSWLSHRKKSGWIGLVFLLGHLVLEWLNHAKHGSHYSDRELALYGIHALFDTGFLWLLLPAKPIPGSLHSSLLASYAASLFFSLASSSPHRQYPPLALPNLWS